MTVFINLQNISSKLFLNRQFIIFAKCRAVGPPWSICNVFFNKASVTCFPDWCTSDEIHHMLCTTVIEVTSLWGCSYDSKSYFGLFDLDILSTDVRLLHFSVQSLMQNFLLERKSSNLKGSWCLHGLVFFRIARMKNVFFTDLQLASPNCFFDPILYERGPLSTKET